MPGAYGLQILGAPGAAEQLVAGEPEWPTLEVERRVARVPDRPNSIEADRAELALLGDGLLRLERDPLRATFTTAEALSDDALVHPYLAPAAAVAGYWLGREALHAGAFSVDGSAWAIVGPKGSGKSSLLAMLARMGIDVVSDDAVILDRDVVYAGPRSIDLREEPAAEVVAGDALGVLGDRERWRLKLPLVQSSSRLSGWIFLSWGDSVQLAPATAGSRLERLLAHRMIRGLAPPDPRLLFDLAALPALQLTRPRSWSQLETVASSLVAAVA